MAYLYIFIIIVFLGVIVLIARIEDGEDMDEEEEK
jgi:hypothetical protein